MIPLMPRYETHDNGGRAYAVEVDEAAKTASIHELDEEFQPVRRLYTINYLNVFPGTSSGQTVACDHGPEEAQDSLGNSVILEVPNPERSARRRFMFIGHVIFEFDTALEDDSDIPFHLHSPIGPSDVPYPTFVSPNFSYFMLYDAKYAPTQDVVPHCDGSLENAYQAYYSGTLTAQEPPWFRSVHVPNAY